jgi:hypothetical protein
MTALAARAGQLFGVGWKFQISDIKFQTGLSINDQGPNAGVWSLDWIIEICLDFDASILELTESSVVASQDADHYALNAEAVGFDDSGFHGSVGGLEADLVAAFFEVSL